MMINLINFKKIDKIDDEDSDVDDEPLINFLVDQLM